MKPPTMFPYDWPELRFAEAEVPQRICNMCDAPMEHLADLRAEGPYPAKRIFRCRHCNNVVSELQ